MSHLLLDLHTAGNTLDATWLASHALMLWTLSAAIVVWQRTRRRRFA